MSDFYNLSFHCQYGYLNNTLKDYLFSLEVPCPKFLMTTFDALPPSTSHEDLLLRSSIWNFLRTLSRQVGAIQKSRVNQCILWVLKDFNSTGRVYENYMTKWITHIRSAVPKQSRPQLSVCITGTHASLVSLTCVAENGCYESVAETKTS